MDFFIDVVRLIYSLALLIAGFEIAFDWGDLNSKKPDWRKRFFATTSFHLFAGLSLWYLAILVVRDTRFIDFFL